MPMIGHATSYPIPWLAAAWLLVLPFSTAVAQDTAVRPVPAERLTLEQIDRLPDDRIVEAEDGERITAGELKAMRAAEAEAAAAHAAAAKRERDAMLEALREKPGTERANRLETENAKIVAVLERLRGAQAELAEIRKEAIDLYQRSERARLPERANLSERAKLLLMRLDELEKAATAELVPAPRTMRR